MIRFFGYQATVRDVKSPNKKEGYAYYACPLGLFFCLMLYLLDQTKKVIKIDGIFVVLMFNFKLNGNKEISLFLLSMSNFQLESETPIQIYGFLKPIGMMKPNLCVETAISILLKNRFGFRVFWHSQVVSQVRFTQRCRDRSPYIIVRCTLILVAGCTGYRLSA